ncbi:hypothetical protein BK660_26715 [Pseudomonas brassicacearum]|uniref:Uncharacterized protein n=1 Tax=Pseudomonas brassicacearum TaxID=930166 RepID=A0A423HS51_9PSED|nr:hypothetical protein [Pseudomonas brassicacearum]RON16023.1 hypothetical protein BK660_26715 [Pseudomonas brassicacearum]
MDRLEKIIKQLSVENPINKFEWKVPENCPFYIPDDIVDQYSRNVYLKENCSHAILSDKSLDNHYWLIQIWGGIGSFKQHEKNNKRILKFLTEVEGERLTKFNFDCISSLSKVASFIHPDRFAIYDSRAIYTLNWLLFNHTEKPELFPQPAGRGGEIAKYDIQTIFRLSKRDVTYRSYINAYHDYCKLLVQLAKSVFGESGKLYMVEMLLFMIAPTKIVQQIESCVSLKVEIV